MTKCNSWRMSTSGSSACKLQPGAGKPRARKLVARKNMGGFGNKGYLLGVLIMRESYYLGVYVRGPLFSETPI